MNVEETYVSLAAFNATNVGAMKSANVSKSFLANARPLSQRPKSNAERFQIRSEFAFCHRDDVYISDDYKATYYE